MYAHEVLVAQHLPQHPRREHLGVYRILRPVCGYRLDLAINEFPDVDDGGGARMDGQAVAITGVERPARDIGRTGAAAAMGGRMTVGEHQARDAVDGDDMSAPWTSADQTYFAEKLPGPLAAQLALGTVWLVLHHSDNAGEDQV